MQQLAQRCRGRRQLTKRCRRGRRETDSFQSVLFVVVAVYPNDI